MAAHEDLMTNHLHIFIKNKKKTFTTSTSRTIIDSQPFVKLTRLVRSVLFSKKKRAQKYVIFFDMHLRLHIFFGQLLWLVAVLNGKSFHGEPGYGRNLVVKSYPAVEDYQSNIYEVFMEPYYYVSNFRNQFFNFWGGEHIFFYI